MTLRQTLWVLVLTAVYLCFELAFNARLLDVVGGGADDTQIHSIEHFGRSLSGIALALFVLQMLLGLKTLGIKGERGGIKRLTTVTLLAGALSYVAASTKLPPIACGVIALVAAGLTALIAQRLRSSGSNPERRPGHFGILLVCVLMATCVFFSLQWLVDTLVDSSSPAFRHATQNIVLVQKALVDGKVRIDGLSEDGQIFARPEGKAFLALFPLMAASVDHLEDKIRSVKLDLLRQDVSSRNGGPEAYHRKYVEAVRAAADQYKQYSNAGNSGSAVNVEERQQKAWDDYRTSLSKHGWTPFNVPDRYRLKVLRQVQGKVPVPNDWDLADEGVFRQAVARQIESRSQVHGNSVSYHGKQIPLGLSWPAFFAHPAVQSELSAKLGLPRQVVLLPDYRTGEAFERDVFTPVLDSYAKRQLVVYEAPVDSFANGAANAEWARAMARAAIVPPVALFFSLLGAIGHICKLSYLSLKACVQPIAPKWPGLRYLVVVPLLVFLGIGVTLQRSDNDVTRSRLYGFLQNQVLSRADWVGRLEVNAAHMVAVGQGSFYPFDEMLRTQVLGGMSFGYVPKSGASPSQ